MTGLEYERRDRENPAAMSTCYFAYGSNMNPRRMADRGMRFVAAEPGCLSGWRLHFNKRARGKTGVAYANIMPVAGHSVEGVLYQLVDRDEIRRMDPFEGYPELYRRQLMDIDRGDGGRVVSAWVYVATPAWQQEGLLPERHYLNHLLAGRPWLSPDYYRALRSCPCLHDQS